MLGVCAFSHYDNSPYVLAFRIPKCETSVVPGSPGRTGRLLFGRVNKDLHHDRAKYVTVRNWSLVEGDTATINKFDYVDYIYSDVKYHKDDIDALQETIRKKYDIMMEKKQKQQNQKRRK